MLDADTLQSIYKQLQAITDEQRAMRDQQHEDNVGVSQRLTALETTVAVEGRLCPFREDIARSANNREQIRANTGRLDKLESALTTVRVQLGGIGVTMGTVGAVITSVVMKALGQ